MSLAFAPGPCTSVSLALYVHVPLCQWHVFLSPHTSMSVAFLVAWLLTGTGRCNCSMAYAWNGGGSYHEDHFCRVCCVFVLFSWQTKHVFCHDKSALVMTKLLSHQNCLSQQIFVVKKVFRKKHNCLTVVATCGCQTECAQQLWSVTRQNAPNCSHHWHICFTCYPSPWMVPLLGLTVNNVYVINQRIYLPFAW